MRRSGFAPEGWPPPLRGGASVCFRVGPAGSVSLLLEAKRSGRAVLLTTHQLEFSRGLADRAVLLLDGAVVAEGPYDVIVDGPLIRQYGLL